MMISAPAQFDLDHRAVERSDRSARRALMILCVLYLLLGIVDAGYFNFSHYQGLGDATAAATSTLADLRRQVPPAPAEAMASAENAQISARADLLRGRARLAGYGAGLLILVLTFLSARRRHSDRVAVTNAATLMILLLGVVLLASRLAVQRVLPATMIWGLLDVVVLHVLACAVMPWTWREATLPFGLLFIVWVLAFNVPGASELPLLDRVVVVIMSSLLLLPGGLLAQWRARRRDEEAERIMLVGRVESYGGELSRARIVHEAMFPPSFSGHVRFEYEYQPIQEIGGDYVHVYACPHSGKVTVTLLDVAGHGLAAALTVNRLFGELERILAENPAAEPAEVMVLLNRYINLTMARHSLYATGTCMMLDPASGNLQWVSAGHPPSLIRHVDGRVSELPTTTVLLGALEAEHFDAGMRSVTLSPGDTIIAFTDGAFEARDATGERFGLKRVRETAGFDPPPRNWPKFIANAVASHHEGYAEDDVLIAALTLHSMRVPSAVPAARAEPAVVAG